MRTSSEHLKTWWRPRARRALETATLAAAFGFVPELMYSRLGTALTPHPGWLVVLLLAARDGRDGCLAGLIAAAAAIAAAAWAAGRDPAAAYARLSSGPDLVAFGASLVVSWVGSWHLRREADLERRFQATERRETEARATIEALSDAVAKLRARVDRAAMSLSFLRDVATRIEGPNQTDAAEAAADLAIARTGAAAAAVRVGADGFRRLLAVRDARGPSDLTPLELRTADLTIPIRSGNVAFGVIALWGVRASALDEAISHDLSVIAAWCAPALSGDAPGAAGLLAGGRHAS